MNSTLSTPFNFYFHGIIYGILYNFYSIYLLAYLDMYKDMVPIPKRLACAIEKQKIEDALLDFLLKACDIGWNHNTSRYERKIHMQRRLKLYKWHCMIKTRKELRKGFNNM